VADVGFGRVLGRAVTRFAQRHALDLVLFVLAAYRLIEPGSEWRLHRQWYGRTALADLLGADDSLADPHVLYGCHRRLLEHRRCCFSI